MRCRTTQCNILGSKQVHPASVLINRGYLSSFIWYQFVLVRTNKYSDHHTMFTTIRMGPIVGLWKWKCLRGLVGHWTEPNKGQFGTLRFQKTHTSDTTYKSCGAQIKDAFCKLRFQTANTQIARWQIHKYNNTDGFVDIFGATCWLLNKLASLGYGVQELGTYK